MPGNIITINSNKEYYVGDSKMDELLKWLDNNGLEESEVLLDELFTKVE